MSNTKSPSVVPAVVMAAGGPDDPLCEAFDQPSRGLVSLAGIPLVAHTVAALDAARTVGAVAVTHRPEDREAFEAIEWTGDPPTLASVAETDSHAASMKAGLGPLPPSEHVLIVPGDMALLTPESVDDFVEQAVALNVDLCYPVIHHERCRERFPGTKRTAVRLQDGEFTGGNLSLVRPRFLREHSARIDQAFRVRKHPVRMVRWLGLRCMLRLLVGRCAVRDVAAAAARALKCTTGFVVSDYPEMGFDVDKVSDFEEAQRLLQPRS